MNDYSGAELNNIHSAVQLRIIYFEILCAAVFLARGALCAIVVPRPKTCIICLPAIYNTPLCFRYTPLRCYAPLNIQFGEPSKQALQFAFTCSILLLIDLRFAMPANLSVRSVFDFAANAISHAHTRAR